MTVTDCLVYQSYLQARDAGALEPGVEDFASYVQDKFSKRLAWSYAQAGSDWRRYCRILELPDFAPVNYARLSESFDDQSTTLSPMLQLRQYERLCDIALDDAATLRDRPAAMGRAAARTLSKAISRAITDAVSPDGEPLLCFPHHNLITRPLDVDALIAAAEMLNEQTDPDGNRIGLRPHTLLVGGDLESEAIGLLPAATKEANRRGSTLLVLTELAVDEYQDAGWQLFADPNEVPVLGVGFLEDQQEPVSFYAEPGERNALAEAPEKFEGPTSFKVLHDWDVTTFDHRGVVGSPS